MRNASAIRMRGCAAAVGVSLSRCALPPRGYGRSKVVDWGGVCGRSPRTLTTALASPSPLEAGAHTLAPHIAYVFCAPNLTVFGDLGATFFLLQNPFLRTILQRNFA